MSVTKVRDIAIVLITMDRTPRGKDNYLTTTLANFKRAGVFSSPRLHSFHVCDSGSPSGWLVSEVESVGLSGFLSLHMDGNRLACENAGYALVTGGKTDATWTLFCEDDLDLCVDFLDSVGRWLDDHGTGPTSDRYRVFIFGTPYPQVQWCVERDLTSWEYPVPNFYGTQCFAIRREDALSLGAYLLSNPRVRGIFNPNAYDLMFHDWMANTYPTPDDGYTDPTPHLFLASVPSFVQHVGRQSVCTGKDITHTFESWPGQDWSYKSDVYKWPVDPKDHLQDKCGVCGEVRANKSHDPGYCGARPHPFIRARRSPSVLWIGDAVVSTGFSRCTHAVCDHLHNSGWTVNVIGMGYYGDPHTYPYTVWPAIAPLDGCRSYGGEMRLPLLLDKLKPDVVVILNDPWNVDGYFTYLSQVRAECVSAGSLMPEVPPVVGWLAVDAYNQKGGPLNQLAHVVTWTEFGRDELVKCGYKGPTSVVPLGVDRDIFHPRDKAESRRRCLPSHVPSDAYIVGFVGRNQPRKRLDLTIRYFAKWVRDCAVDNAYLYLHVAPTGELSCDLQSLVRYYGIPKGHVVIVTPHVGTGNPESAMPHVYSALDVFLTTTEAEGWCLPVLEAMACGVPCIVPDLPGFDWVGDAALTVPCAVSSLVAPHGKGGLYTVGGVVDEDAMVDALNRMYITRNWSDNDHGGWAFLSGRGVRLAESLTWERTGREFQRVLEIVLGIGDTTDKCEWPDCSQPALCSSGNYGNRLVCAGHFDVTNGPGFSEESIRVT